MKLLTGILALVLMTNTFAEEKKDAVGEQSATATTCEQILNSQSVKGSSGDSAPVNGSSTNSSMKQ